ncbi:MAG: LacI family DNA-binding transcriptional regulator [Chloroflexota bacterium]
MESRQPRQRATIQGVADPAGVSTAAVSRVLNGSMTVHGMLAERT